MTPDEEFKIKLSGSMGRNEALLSGLTDDMHDLKKDIKGLAKHNDRVTQNLREHFDNRITVCKNEFKEALMDNHFDREQTRDKITTAINANNDRIWGRVKAAMWGLTAFAAVVAFVHEYGFILIELIKQKGIN